MPLVGLGERQGPANQTTTACPDGGVESFDEIGIRLTDAVGGVGEYLFVAVPIVGLEAALAQPLGNLLEQRAGRTIRAITDVVGDGYAVDRVEDDPDPALLRFAAHERPHLIGL